MKWLLIVFCLLALVTQAQKPEVVVQLGHTDKVSAVTFSPDGQWLISGGGDNAIKIWDMKTGLLVRTLTGHKWPIKSLACSPDGKTLVSGSEDDLVKIWDLSTGKLRKTIAAHTSDVKTVLFSPSGKTIATCGGKEIKLWDSNGNLLRTITGHTEDVGSIAFNGDGTQLAAGEDRYSSSSIKIWDPNTGKLLKTITPIGSGIQNIQFNPSGNELLCAAGGGYRDGKLFVMNSATTNLKFTLSDSSGVWTARYSRDGKLFFWGGSSGVLKMSDAQTGNVLKHHSMSEFGAINALAVSPDGQYLACAVGWKIVVFNIISYKPFQEFSTRSNFVWSLGLTNDGDYMASASGHIYGKQTIKLWSLRMGKIIRSYQGHKSWILSLAVGSDNRYIGTGSDDASVAYWELPGVKSVNAFRSTSGSLNIGNKKVNAVAFHPGGRYLAGVTADGSIIYMRAGRSTYDKMQSPSKGLASVCFAPDGKTIVAGNNNGGVEFWDVESKSLTQSINSHAYNYNVLDSAKAIPYGSVLGLGFGSANTIAVAAVAYSPDGKLLATAGGPDIKLWDAATLKPQNVLYRNAGMTSVAFSHDGKYVAAGGADHTATLWDVASGKLLQVFEGHQHEVRSVAFSNDDRFLYTGSLDTQIKVWDLKSSQEVLSYISIANSDDYVIMTPAGYYMSSKGGSKVLGFRVGNKTYPFEQFDLKYHRPDLVLKEITRISYQDAENSPNQRLINSYGLAYKKRLKKMGFDESKLTTDWQIPEVHFKTTGLPSSTREQQISLEVEAKDTKYPLDRINISINDVPVYGVNGISLKEKNTQQWTQKINLTLNKGINEIQISALNSNGTESLSETHVISCDAPVTQKPNLYVIALGVSSYKNSQMNLNYAAKDARDLVQLLISQKDSYGKIVVDTLLNQQATVANILDLRKKLMATQVDDRIIIFLAGHGLLDKDLNYYLGTHDVDFTEPSKNGLAYEKLEQLLDGIPARNKILLMDACHSGEIDKEELTAATAQAQKQTQVKFRAVPGVTVQRVGLENSFELMKELFSDLRKGNGTTVISSASGAEYAMEGAAWNNGIFTYCLLSALKEKKADLNGDGKIMLSELQQYLMITVPELTEGKQRPTSRVENLSNDFQVWY